jgi:hypothetical protein
MEWLVPILFVIVSLAQWWIKHRKAVSPQASNPEPQPPQDPLDEFGDLLEALGRRRHESPPSPPLPQKAPEHIILPSIEARKKILGLPSLPVIPTSPLLREKPPLLKKKEVPLIARRRFVTPSTRWSEVIVLSEILAPPVALR